MDTALSIGASMAAAGLAALITMGLISAVVGAITRNDPNENTHDHNEARARETYSRDGKHWHHVMPNMYGPAAPGNDYDPFFNPMGH